MEFEAGVVVCIERVRVSGMGIGLEGTDSCCG